MIVNELVTLLSYKLNDKELAVWKKKAEDSAERIAKKREELDKKVSEKIKKNANDNSKNEEALAKKREQKQELYHKLWVKLEEKERKEKEKSVLLADKLKEKSEQAEKRRIERLEREEKRKNDNIARDKDRQLKNTERQEQLSISRSERFKEATYRYIERVQIRQEREAERRKQLAEQAEKRRIESIEKYREQRAKETDKKIANAVKDMEQRRYQMGQDSDRNKAYFGNYLGNISGQVTGSGSNMLGDFIKTSGDFEAVMNSIKAFGGLDDKQTSGLKNQIKIIAENSRYQPLEIAESTKELTKQGYKANQLKTFLPNSLDFATAVETTPQEAAKLLSSMMHSFGINDVKHTRGISDVLTAGLNESALDFNDFSYALQYMAPASKVSGGNLQSTTKFLALLSQAGLKGTPAGTSGRKIATDIAVDMAEVMKEESVIQQETKKGKKKGFQQQRMESLKHLGIKESDVMTTTKDAVTGKQSTFFDITKALISVSEKIKGKSDFEKASIYKDLFGRTAQNAASLIGIMQKNNPKEVKRLEQAIYNPDGATKKTVDARN